MKKTLFFTSLAVATGITMLELFIFFNYFAKITQDSLSESMKLLADNTYEYINNNFDYKKGEVEIYKLKLYIDDLHKISNKKDKINNNQLIVKSFVLILLLVIGVILSYVILDRKDNVSKEYFGIFLGVVIGSVTQFLFVKHFVFNYQAKSQESLLNYILDKLGDIVKLC